MLFSSFSFLVFFPIVLILFYATQPKYRWLTLLIASYYFYMSWRPIYIILIMVSTLIDYVVTHRMDRCEQRKDRKKYLYISLVSNLGLLSTFKYFNLFASSVNVVAQQSDISFAIPYSSLLLPVGISFYTFQTLSYTIDVYRGVLKPEKNLGKFALYVSFFPQLVAGPIERAKHLLPQFNNVTRFTSVRILDSLYLIVWGLFKKVVIADRLAAVAVDPVFNDLGSFGGIHYCIAIIFFAVQIYCDFSGYSDMAIGCARLMGIDLMKNFDRPYFALSVREFWRRWHISLTTWFRDYVYYPLGGNRSSLKVWMRNIFIVFLLSGIWHGAQWTFIFWGCLHAFFYMFEVAITDVVQRFWPGMMRWGQYSCVKLLRWCVMITMVLLAWLFFRAQNFSDALYMLQHLLDWNVSSHLDMIPVRHLKYEFVMSVVLIVILFAVEKLDGCGYSNRSVQYKYGRSVKVIMSYLFVLSIIFLRSEHRSEFIYFQF